MATIYTILLLILLRLSDRNEAIICETERFHNRSSGTIGTNLIQSVQENCPLELRNKYNCRSKNINKISDIEGNDSYCGLDISKNALKKLENETFRNWTNLVALDLSENEIATIDPDAFKGLQNLRYLNLKHTRLDKISGFSRAFRHLPGLNILDLSENNFNDYVSIGDAINHTRQLQTLALEGCPSCAFGPEFGQLEHLVNLDQTGEEVWSYCLIVNLTDHYFENLPFLKRVNLSDCCIRNISSGAFATLTQIEELDLSHNYNLTFDQAAIGLKGLSNAILLKKLYLNYIHSCFQGHSIMLKKEHVISLSNLSVQELHIEGNTVDVFEYGTLSAFPDTLVTLNLRYNRLVLGSYLAEFFDNNQTLPNLQLLDISYQHSVFSDQFPDDLHSNAIIRTKRVINHNIWNNLFMQFVPELSFPPNLQTIKCKHMGWNFPIPELHVSPNNCLKQIDLSFNGLCSWIGPLNGLKRLEDLSLAYNYCDNVTPVFFSNFDGLKTLKIQGNLLGSILRKDIDGIIFSSLKSLQRLNISSNKICNLPPNIFQHMASLEELVISYNMLSKWEIDITNMLNLTSIDMSFNKIYTLPDKFTDHIDRIVKNQNVTIDLKGNPISCSCENIRFLKWMMDAKFKLEYDSVCDPEIKSDTIQKKLISLEKECTSKIGLIAGCMAFIFLVSAIIFGGIIYRYKWHLRYLYYSARNSIGSRHQGEDYSELYQYDSFISYADEDKLFIYNEILPVIEEKFGLKLCIADRDFTPGVSIPENIIRAISSSRRTIFILSKAFLQSYWCKYELNMARIESEKKNRKLLVVVMYNKVANDLLPLEVMEVIRNQTYIDYLDDEIAREVFWKRLKAIIV